MMMIIMIESSLLCEMRRLLTYNYYNILQKMDNEILVQTKNTTTADYTIYMWSICSTEITWLIYNVFKIMALKY